MTAGALEEILAKERKLQFDLCDPDITEIDVGPLFLMQVGLRPVMVDPIGRLWDVGSNSIKMIFDPRKEKP